ncbi:hypothetical protein VNO78_02839 [Psophocarpus tetragonolobus]|uniref:Uncharacterized protein n=1 Tax=Psophocarpus tetragonolobus TaxID=3891 RepID=A0AAN9XVD8_PSOTE
MGIRSSFRTSVVRLIEWDAREGQDGVSNRGMRSPGDRTDVLDPSRLVPQLLNEKRLNTCLLLEKLSEILLNHIQNLEFFPVFFRRFRIRENLRRLIIILDFKLLLRNRQSKRVPCTEPFYLSSNQTSDNGMGRRLSYLSCGENLFHPIGNRAFCKEKAKQIYLEKDRQQGPKAHSQYEIRPLRQDFLSHSISLMRLSNSGTPSYSLSTESLFLGNRIHNLSKQNESEKATKGLPNQLLPSHSKRHMYS